MERFWSKVQFGGWSDCWLWAAGMASDGYGVFRYKGVSQRAHRVAYELLVGPIPEGFQVDHVVEWGCGVRRCVNPLHLEAVTQAENVRRAAAAGAYRGPNNPRSRKTHCPQGHPYSGDNLRVGKDRRTCRACAREWARNRRRVAQ